MRIKKWNKMPWQVESYRIYKARISNINYLAASRENAEIFYNDLLHAIVIVIDT
jgi:hypothetical protein